MPWTADFSVDCTRRPQWYFDRIHILEYVQWYAVRVGFHVDGSWSPLERLDDALTAISCGRVRSLAKLWRLLVVHELAPDRHASASATT